MSIMSSLSKYLYGIFILNFLLSFRNGSFATYFAAQVSSTSICAVLSLNHILSIIHLHSLSGLSQAHQKLLHFLSPVCSFMFEAMLVFCVETQFII